MKHLPILAACLIFILSTGLPGARAAGLRDFRRAFEAGEFAVKVLQFDNKVPDFNLRIQVIPNSQSPARAQKFILQPGTQLVPTSEAKGDEFDLSLLILKPVVINWTPDGWATQYVDVPIHYVNYYMKGPRRGDRLKVMRAPQEFIEMVEYKRGGTMAELQTAIWLAANKDRSYEDHMRQYGKSEYEVTRETYVDLRNYARRALIAAEKQRIHEAQRAAIEAARALETPEERKVRVVQEAFDAKDLDQDGLVKFEEFVGEVRRGLLSSKQLMARRRGRPFKKYDKDGDGAITRDEWLAYHKVDRLL